MATNSLQNESAQAKPLTLRGVGAKLEDIEASASDLAALIYTAARDSELDPETGAALRAIGKLAAQLGCDLIQLTEAVHEASEAERGENVADFPRQ